MICLNCCPEIFFKINVAWLELMCSRLLGISGGGKSRVQFAKLIWAGGVHGCDYASYRFSFVYLYHFWHFYQYFHVCLICLCPRFSFQIDIVLCVAVLAHLESCSERPVNFQLFESRALQPAKYYYFEFSVFCPQLILDAHFCPFRYAQYLVFIQGSGLPYAICVSTLCLRYTTSFVSTDNHGFHKECYLSRSLSLNIMVSDIADTCILNHYANIKSGAPDPAMVLGWFRDCKLVQFSPFD